MKLNFFLRMSFFLVSLIVFISCNKIEIQNDECRLVSSTSEFGTLTYTYNQWGLLDRYHISNFEGYFKMEYDASGYLVKSRFYADFEDTLENTILFSYEHNLLVKAVWYDRNTKTKVDEVLYTYNSDGKLSESQSVMQNYSTTYKYTPDGDNVTEWNFYFGGVLNYTQQYTYLPPHHKDPYLAIPGLKNDFAFSNGGTSASKWYSTSEKDISYDEEGKNPQIILDQDPGKSVIQFNGHNYVTATDFFDKLTNTYVHFRFDYENCVGDNANMAISSQKLPIASTGKIIPLFLRTGAVKSIKEQVTEWHKQYLKSD